MTRVRQTGKSAPTWRSARSRGESFRRVPPTVGQASQRPLWAPHFAHFGLAGSGGLDGVSLGRSYSTLEGAAPT